MTTYIEKTIDGINKVSQGELFKTANSPRVKKLDAMRADVESYRNAVMSNPLPNASEIRKLREKEDELANYEAMVSWYD